MNRPIKFRAWITSENWRGYKPSLMWQWEEIRSELFSDLRFIDMFGGSLDGTDKSLIMMQFTGLLDRNDKEIYEGDILRTFVKGRQVIAPMVWNKNLAQFGLDASVYFKAKDHEVVHVRTNDERPEILGNIFENPELMQI